MIKTGKKDNIIKRNISLIVAFFVPILILLVIYATREIYPFGDQMYLRSDMYHQYAPFLKLFQNMLKNGGSMSYSFRVGLGSNFLSTYAYYLASPLNWVVGLLPSDHIPEIMSAFIFLKSGLMSATMTYYLRRRFLSKKTATALSAKYIPERKTQTGTELIAACFGIFYAMSGYMAAYSWNVMWLDCLVLLPLFVLGLERLVKEGKCLLYTICFALAVISNYYIAIMLCIFSLLYFIYLMAAEAEIKNAKDAFRRIGRYFLYSFIGGAIGAVIFLPALLTLFGTASADSEFPSTLSAYFNILEMFAHGTMNTKVTMMDGYLPNIYSGMATFALVPLFWLNRAIPVKERAGKTALMGIMMFSFAFNIPAFIWHGFHFPNSLPSRQSFIYIFLVLAISFEALMRIRKVTAREIVLSFGVAVAAVFVLQVLYGSEEYTMAIAYASAAFLIVYGITALLLHKRKYVVRMAAVAVLIIACIAESMINTDETGYGTTSRISYTEDNEAIETVLSSIEDDGFYRVEKLRRRTKNDGAWSGYRSASLFSSVTTEALSDVYKAFGMQSGTNAFSFYGNTPLTSALLGIRYKMTNVQEPEDPFITLINSAPVTQAKDSEVLYGDDVFENVETTQSRIYLYRSKYCLPLGFMVKETTQAEVNLMAQNPFDVQNDFVDAAKGAAPIFKVGSSMVGSELTYQVPEDGHLFFHVGQKLENLTVTTVTGKVPGSSNTFTSLECAMIVDIGEVREGDEFKITTTDEEIDEFMVIPAMLDSDALDDAILALSEEPYEVETFTDTMIKGTVETEKRGILFTTIPYDKGWRVYVDGRKTKPGDFYEAFIQVPLEAGEHTVEFRYRVPGVIAGLIISILALAALVVLTVLKSRKNKQQQALLPQEAAQPLSRDQQDLLLQEAAQPLSHGSFQDDSNGSAQG